jgi:hypothetical protein
MKRLPRNSVCLLSVAVLLLLGLLVASAPAGAEVDHNGLILRNLKENKDHSIDPLRFSSRGTSTREIVIENEMNTVVFLTFLVVDPEPVPGVNGHFKPLVKGTEEPCLALFERRRCRLPVTFEGIGAPEVTADLHIVIQREVGRKESVVVPLRAIRD